MNSKRFEKPQIIVAKLGARMNYAVSPVFAAVFVHKG
jgi:hypothetical protein